MNTFCTLLRSSFNVTLHTGEKHRKFTPGHFQCFSVESSWSYYSVLNPIPFLSNSLLYRSSSLIMLQFTAFDKVYVFSSLKFCNLTSFTNEHLLQWRAWTRAEMSILETQHLTRQKTVLGDFWHSWHNLIFWSSFSNYFSVVLDTTKIIFYLSFLSNFSHPGTSTKRTKQSKVSWQRTE